MNVEINESLSFEDMYNQLSSLRFVETRLSPLVPIFCAHQRIISKLKEFNDQFVRSGKVDAERGHDFMATLSNIEPQVQTLDANAKFLLTRISSAIQMVSDEAFK